MTDQAIGRIAVRRTDLALPLILTLSVTLRLAAALYLGNTVEVLPGTFDQVSYHALALRILDGHGFSFATASWPMTAADAPTAHWSYLYTLYLSAVYTIFGPNPLAARIIQAVVVGIMQPYAAYILGRQVFGQRTGLLAAAFTAVYIYFIYYAATLMTEPFYITGIMVSLYLFLRLAAAPPRQELLLSVALGLTLGATVLLRQLFLITIPFLLIWLWGIRFLAGRRVAENSVSPRTPLLPTVVIVGIVAMMILPFTLYNYGRFDRFVLLNTNAGYALFWANHPVYGTQFEGILPPELGTYQELIPEELRGLDEAALEQALLERGIQFVVEDPGRYLLLSLSRVPVYFMFWPSADSGMISNISRVASFALFLPLMLGGLAYSLVNSNLRRRTIGQSSLLLLFMVVYAGIHLASWALIRYRLPLDAVLLIYAGLAASLLWLAMERRKSASTSA